MAHIIDAMGGHRRVAAVLRVPPGTVSSWRSRGAIPARAWAALVARAKADGIEAITLETLATVHGGLGDTEMPETREPGKSRRVLVHVDSGLLAEATELGIEVQALANEAVRERIRREKIRRWQAEHADVIAWYNDHIEKDGIFGEEWRTF